MLCDMCLPHIALSFGRDNKHVWSQRRHAYAKGSTRYHAGGKRGTCRLSVAVSIANRLILAPRPERLSGGARVGRTKQAACTAVMS